MAILSVFDFISLNGNYKDADNDIRWHQHSADQMKLSEEGANSGSILVFGRTTYEMMASFWPTEQAMATMPIVATGMNAAEKIVFSRTMRSASWHNTRVIDTDMLGAIKELKKSSPKDMTILGSGSIVSQLTQHGLIDTYQMLIDPVILGGSANLFASLPARHKTELKLLDSKVYQSGSVLLTYGLAGSGI
jgi:dihydrofolate reductase